MSTEDDDDLDFPEDELPLEHGTGVGAATAVAVALPMMTAGIAVVAGAVVGILGTWLVMRGEPEKVEVPRDYTEDELAAACKPMLDEALDELNNAEKKVETLEGRVNAKQGEITELEEEMKRRAQRGALLVEERNELKRQLESAKAELVNLEKRLEIAIEEKELLTIELTETKEDLEEQKYQTHVAKEDALDYKWRDFIGKSQLEICERGNRKKMSRCRETVEETAEPYKDKFDHCVRSGQAVPSVREIEKKSDPLPQYAEWIDEENKVTKGYYVLLCDPTLPEATGDGFKLPNQPADGGGDDLFSEFDELPDLEDLDD